MTMISTKFQTCYVCGHRSSYELVASTNTFGSPDLDLRPPEMYRSTMHTWIQFCDNCGYSCPDISEGFLGVKSIINSKKYGPINKNKATNFFSYKLKLLADFAIYTL